MGLDNFRDNRQDLSEKMTCELKSEYPEVPARRKYGRRTKRSPEVTQLKKICRKRRLEKEAGARSYILFYSVNLGFILGVRGNSQRVLRDSLICGSMSFINFGQFLAILSIGVSSAPYLSFLSFYDTIWQGLTYLEHSIQWQGYFFHSFFSLWFNLDHSIDLSSNPLILSSSMSPCS